MANHGLIGPHDVAALQPVAARYATALTPDLVRLIDRSDPHDPLARQFIPSADEAATTPHQHDDPIGDEAYSPVPGVVHRYRDRALLKLVHTCPVYCRFCFRRAMVGPGGDALNGAALARALAYIADHEDIVEVILTGGDPLMLSARRIEYVSQRLAAMAHVQLLRWHSRVPVVDAARITPEVIAALSAVAGTCPVTVVVHTNHARELTQPARAALRAMREAGLILRSQSVLLAGVNDDAATLADLMRALLSVGVQPYHLHHLDPAPGTAHFHVPIARGQALMDALRTIVSGLALPHYVVDIPGGYGKVPLTPSTWSPDDGTVSDHQGTKHRIT
ncbi:MAG: lysine-2,3-aminomutase-like protein [Pseudomonadota bacterium]